MKILIADHNEMLGELIRYELVTSGHKVKLATDGEQALSFLDEHSFDMIITDILLPFYSGLELINTINSNRKKNKPKIIILTQIHNEKTVTRAFELGIDDYITKPFDPDYLMIQVEKMAVE